MSHPRRPRGQHQQFIQQHGAFTAAMVIVHLLTDDGEEREERWPSLERFRTWAMAEGITGHWTAYEDDPDGEGAVIGRGTVGGRPINGR